MQKNCHFWAALYTWLLVVSPETHRGCPWIVCRGTSISKIACEAVTTLPQSKSWLRHCIIYCIFTIYLFIYLLATQKLRNIHRMTDCRPTHLRTYKNDVESVTDCDSLESHTCQHWATLQYIYITSHHVTSRHVTSHHVTSASCSLMRWFNVHQRASCLWRVGQPYLKQRNVRKCLLNRHGSCIGQRVMGHSSVRK